MAFAYEIRGRDPDAVPVPQPNRFTALAEAIGRAVLLGRGTPELQRTVGLGVLAYVLLRLVRAWR